MDVFILFACEEGRIIYVLEHRTRSSAARHYYYVASGVPRGLTPLLYTYD